MSRYEETKVYIVHLVRDGTSDPLETRIKIRGKNFVRYCSDRKDGFISSKDFYQIPQGYKCILK
jgi:hypothetical protein